MMSDFTFNVFITSLFAFIVIVLFVFALKAHEKVNFLENNGCALTSKRPTGKRVYCGKACTRAEMYKEYSCSKLAEPLVIIE